MSIRDRLWLFWVEMRGLIVPLGVALMVVLIAAIALSIHLDNQAREYREAQAAAAFLCEDAGWRWMQIDERLWRCYRGRQ